MTVVVIPLSFDILLRFLDTWFSSCRLQGNRIAENFCPKILKEVSRILCNGVLKLLPQNHLHHIPITIHNCQTAPFTQSPDLDHPPSQCHQRSLILWDVLYFIGWKCVFLDWFGLHCFDWDDLTALIKLDFEAIIWVFLSFDLTIVEKIIFSNG